MVPMRYPEIFFHCIDKTKALKFFLNFKAIIGGRWECCPHIACNVRSTTLIRFAHRRTPVRLSLVVELPSSGVQTSSGHKKKLRSIKTTELEIGGRWEVRTPDPLGVNEMLFQLS